MDHFELETDVPDSDRNRETSEDEKRSQRLKRVDSLHRKPSRAPRKDFSGFHKSTRMCLHAIREAVLHHRWKEATQYLEVYSQALEETSVEQPIACEVIWRLGIEILRHHPDSDLERFNDLYERMKSSGVKNYAKICLEYAFHLMLNGHIQKAKQQLTVAASWRYGKESARQALGLKLIHAYCGFLDYLIWSSKRASASNAEEGEQHNEMHSYFRQALVTMQEIIKQPGVWDQFVCSCVDMLEYYNNEEEALQLLKHYAFNKDFPANPNAHVYLYNYQKKHNASRDELLATLKGLHSLVPSHELMLKYCKLLKISREPKNLQRALCIALDLVEYSCWKKNLKAWLCLFRIARCFNKRCHKDLLKKEREGRKDLWLKMHFKNAHTRMDLKISPRLVSLKIKVKKIMGFVSRYGENRMLRALNAMDVLELYPA